jgi:hypothetical protein
VSQVKEWMNVVATNKAESLPILTAFQQICKGEETSSIRKIEKNISLSGYS